jgi:YYY domain-containing protein
MAAFVLWYLIITLLGWLTFPITFRVFSRLGDKGFGLSKIFGLLIWGYGFWLLNMLHIAQNTLAGELFALIILIAISFFLLRSGRIQDIVDWIKRRRRTVLFSEILFLVAFGFWTLVRASNPEIVGTEKPMELAFINAILKSPQFPPRDPWLSGYAISYYYFGYVMLAMLVRITGVASWVGFNLGSALWFALSASAAFSLVFSLISRWIDQGEGQSPDKYGGEPKPAELFWSLLGPLFLLIVSNIEGFLEMLHSKGIFWTQTAEGVLESGFWRWLDIQELTQAPTLPFSWVPERTSGIWWWRASRVLQDFTAMGQSREVIDEFPFFSYLLSDLHPHVLAIPFVLLAIAFAFHFFLSYQPPSSPGISLVRWVRGLVDGENLPINNVHFVHLFLRSDFWILSFFTGSLAFLNTWDFPIYVGLFAAVFLFRRYQNWGWNLGRFVEFVTFGLITGVLGVLLFFPFYIGFSSQAGGFLPSLFFFTRGIHFWVMFLPLLFPICIWLIFNLKKGVLPGAIGNGIKFAAIVLLGLLISSYTFGGLAVNLSVMGTQWLYSSNPILNGFAATAQRLGGLFNSVQGITNPGDLLQSILLRIKEPGTWVTLFLLIAVVWALLGFRKRHQAEEYPSRSDKSNFGDLHSQNIQDPAAKYFLLLLILLAGGLLIFPEFFYLRDQFGYRINTIFKFYYQAWILLSISAAVVSVFLWQKSKRFVRLLFWVSWIAVILMSLAYPFWAVQMKLDGIQLNQLSLNGARQIEQYSSDEMHAIEWLLNAPDGVILEAVGGSYSGYARISTYTGLPTVLGWPGHESQWRGGALEMGSREADIRQIYQSSNWDETFSLLMSYQVRYIYVGSYERNTYRVNETKLMQNLNVVFDTDSVQIYEVPPLLVEGANEL